MGSHFHLSLCLSPLFFRLMRSPCCVCVYLSLNCFIFYAVPVISKESRRLFSPELLVAYLVGLDGAVRRPLVILFYQMIE
jgi:hypothetical protein